MNTEIFTGRATIYEKYRPNYPNVFIDYLYSELGFCEDSVIADIGSGTGILSRQLLERGSKVICVEPNDSMRQSAEKTLSHYHRFISVGGTAEYTGLEDKSVDFVTVAQAFHWFDLPKFKNECERILKPGGKAILVWNSRVANDKLTIDAGDICSKLCMNFKGFSGGIDEKQESFSEFFRDGIYEHRAFENNLTLDLDGFIGRYLSASYAPKKGELNYVQFIDELTELFFKYSINGELVMPNLTRSYAGVV